MHVSGGRDALESGARRFDTLAAGDVRRLGCRPSWSRRVQSRFTPRTKKLPMAVPLASASVRSNQNGRSSRSRTRMCSLAGSGPEHSLPPSPNIRSGMIRAGRAASSSHPTCALVDSVASGQQQTDRCKARNLVCVRTPRYRRRDRHGFLPLLLCGGRRAPHPDALSTGAPDVESRSRPACSFDRTSRSDNALIRTRKGVNRRTRRVRPRYCNTSRRAARVAWKSCCDSPPLVSSA